MMHYGPWYYHPSVIDNHQYYAPYGTEVQSFHHRNHEHHLVGEETDQGGDEIHDTMTSATSGERSSSADLFRLEFAATQWSKLVSNAEGLFNKLMTSNILPHNEQDQIEQWLCMKQEYEECIASDDTTSLQGFVETTRRSLERIEEVTETDEKTDESGNQIDSKPNCNDCSTSESDLSDDEDDQSDVSTENPGFLEKLDECMNRLKLETDRIVDSKKDEFKGTSSQISPTPIKFPNANNNCIPQIKATPVRNPNTRRNSMLPGSEMCNEVIAFNDSLKSCQSHLLNENTAHLIETNILDNRPLRLLNNDNLMIAQNDNSPDLLVEALKTTDFPEPIKEFKTLSLNNEAKKSQVKKIQHELDGAQKHIEKLQATIKLKERFIADIMKHSDARTSAKNKFQRKTSKLEEKYYNTRTQLAQAENATLYTDSDKKITHKKDIEMYKNMAIHYEKRLMDIEMIKQIAGDSAKKIIERESSLNSSKKQMEKLKRQLKKEEERKKQLEQELAEDQKKIRQLEKKYSFAPSKLKETQSESEEEKSYYKLKMEKSSDQNKNLQDVNARISHLDHVLKEKSMDLEKTADVDEKEALRHEIRNLRGTRDCLLDKKCYLNEKFQKERNLTIVEERKLLECGETIEAIDAMIERKNEMICGRTEFNENQSQHEKEERLLMERELAKLPDGEMITLFYKYFHKVIDLKQSSKNLEEQMAKLEAHSEAQEWCIQTLNNALKIHKLEAERIILVMQKEHEQQLHLLFKHFAEDTSGSSHEGLDKDSEVSKYKRENRALKKRLADVETLLKGRTLPRVASPARIPNQKSKPIVAPHPAPTTKVTRQRNKLIIQKRKE